MTPGELLSSSIGTALVLLVVTMFMAEVVWELVADSILSYFPPNRDIQQIVASLFVAIVVTTAVCMVISPFVWFYAFMLMFAIDFIGRRALER